MLGLLWLLDGVLQLQHQMFTTNFATSVIAPAAQGQPVFVSGLMHLFIRIFLLQPILFNSLIALSQLALGITILWKKTTRYGLIASVAWGLFVWYVGEGLGGLAGGQASLLMGAPGAAFIYAVLALGVLPSHDSSKTKREERLPAPWLAFFWAGLWIMGAIYQLLSGQNTTTDIATMIRNNASGAPGWLTALDTHTAKLIQGIGGNQTTQAHAMHMSISQMTLMPAAQSSGFWFILLLAVVQFLVGIAIFMPRHIRTVGVVSGIILSLLFWAVGQSFGSYYSGLATDPNSAPLYVLLAVTILATPIFTLRGFKRQSDHVFEKIEHALT